MGKSLFHLLRRDVSRNIGVLLGLTLTLAPSADARFLCWEALEHEESPSARASVSANALPNVWEEYLRLWVRLEEGPYAWDKYVRTRYEKLLSHYNDFVQRARLRLRIQEAAKGETADLGELQVAERLLNDPRVSHVEWLAEVRKGEGTPDFRVFYRDGHSQIREVKTRKTRKGFDWATFEERVEKANYQVFSLRKRRHDVRALRAEVEILFSNIPRDRLFYRESTQVAQMRDYFETQSDLTSLLLTLDGKPIYRFTRIKKKGAHGRLWAPVQVQRLDSPIREPIAAPDEFE